ncbi:MAG: cupin domain-containing protein [Eubacteriales bacterium]|nr:cupin domain-containing protein [Eubacteriales bacterium]
MIKTENQQPVRERKDVRGGKGIVTFHDFLAAEEAFGAGNLFTKATIPAGASVGEHRHDGEFEVYYVLAGTAEVNDNGALAMLNAGDMHRCASGESHAIRNAGAGDLEVVMLILNENPGRS